MGDAHILCQLPRAVTDCASPRFVVRPYEPRDREAVREICCETADNGRPMDAWFPDREIFADLLMRYYTDCEPQSLWVAESNTEVVGYLAACQNTRLFRCCMAVWILPVTILKALTRGTLWHPKIRELLRANRAAFCHQPRAAIGAYPAHLHINLRAGFRGLRIGRSLLQHWLRAAHTARIRGVHVVVRADNTQARRFFEAMGFHLLGAGRSYRLPPDNRLVETCIYGLRLPQ